MKSASSKSTGAGCLTVFGLTFASLGLMSLIFGFRGYSNAQKNAWVGIYGGSVFVLVGIGIICLAWWGAKVVRRDQELVEQFPDQPWKWKPDWAAGKLRDQTGTAAVSMWIFAGLWNLVATPSGILGVREAVIKGNHAGWLALLFPIVGIYLLAHASLLTVRRRKFGISEFKPVSLPASPGFQLAGTIYVPARFATQDIGLRLFCVNRRVTGSGKSRRTVETVRWEHEETSTPVVGHGPSGWEIPISFQLPRDVPTTRCDDPNDQNLWFLDAKTSMPGADYGARFEVPVFVTDQQPAAPAPETINGRSGPKAIAMPPERGVTATRRIDGGWDFEFAAARNGLRVVWQVVFVIVFTAAAAMFLRAAWSPLSLIFGLILVLVALALGASLWDMTFVRRTVTVSCGTLSIRSSSPLRQTTRELSAGEIAEIRHKIAFQLGDKPYYAIEVATHAGGKITIASGLSSKRVAEWIVNTMNQSVVG